MNAPQKLHFAKFDAVNVAVELAEVVRSVVPAKAVVDVIADLKALFERFEKCHAIDPDDVKPIAQDDRLWEIRLDITAYSLLLRIYETEIDELPGHIVALRAHEKVVGLSAEEIHELQDGEIAIASQRWDAGRGRYWGCP